MKVLVINQYAGNKGDRAIAYFVTRELQKHGVSSISMSTSNRHLWQNTTWLADHCVKLVPWGWNVERPHDCHGITGRVRIAKSRFWRHLFPVIRRLVRTNRGRHWLPALANREFLRALRDCDLVISTGGHHVTTLLDEDAVSEQLYDMGLVLLAGKPLVLWSQSIGPLDFSEARNEDYVRNVLQRTSHIFLRDQQSEAILQTMNVNGSTVHKTFESVLGLSDACQEYIPPSLRSPSVGIAVYAAQHRPADERALYVRTMASLADHASAMGLRVRFFPMEIEGTGPDDRPLLYEIMREVKDCANVTIEPDMDTPRHLNEVAECRLFVGHKTHSVIFSLAVGTPLVAIAYHLKTRDFMRQYGLDEFCICDHKLQSDDLLRCFDSLVERADETGSLVFEKSRGFGCRVRADFRELVQMYRMK